jgi:Rrf2 family protein
MRTERIAMLSQTATYALRAMSYLASRHGQGPILSQTIAEEMEIPKNFLSKIMHRLVQSGLVLSTRGTRGGFTLSQDPSTIRMIDVVALFMDVKTYASCFLGRAQCDGTCKVHRKWKPISDQIQAMLENTTIDKIL